MLGDSNDDEETDKVEDWDIHNGGKCKQLFGALPEELRAAQGAEEHLHGS